MKNLNKSLIVILFAFLILFVSCINENLASDTNVSKISFDYDFYNSFVSEKSSNRVFVYDPNHSNTENSIEALNFYNNLHNTSIILPDEYHNSVSKNYVEKINIYLDNDWISLDRMNRLENFMSDIITSDFEIAVSNYETQIISLNLGQSEFEIENDFLNLVKTLNETSNQFNVSLTSSDCIFATIALTAAFLGLASCAAGFPCLLASIGYISAPKNFSRACLED